MGPAQSKGRCDVADMFDATRGDSVRGVTSWGLSVPSEGQLNP